MVKFRAPTEVSPEAQRFIDQAKTGAGESRVDQPTLVQTTSRKPVLALGDMPGLNPRVMKQVNIQMPETDHYALKVFVKSIPDMSMQRFILEAIEEKKQRMSRG